MPRFDQQITLADVDPHYQAFVDKFKPKKTTDDCYTPENIYNVVLNWVVKEYGIDPNNIVRPFWPGGDYMSEDYPEGCTVVDNPPFSIITEIVNNYNSAGIKYFLFAPYLTNFTAGERVSHIITGSNITYENGADVPTAFLTNLDTYLLRSCPDLAKQIEEGRAPDITALGSELTPQQTGRIVGILHDFEAFANDNDALSDYITTLNEYAEAADPVSNCTQSK